MIGQAVKKLLESSSGVTGLTERFFPVMVPQLIENPFIVYGITGVENTNSKAETIMDVVSVEVHFYSKSYELVQLAAVQIRLALEKYKGTQEGIYISDVEFVDYRDAYDTKYERFVGQCVFEFIIDANYQG